MCCVFIREETEIIEGEVVEIQIDRPATGTVRMLHACFSLFLYAAGLEGHKVTTVLFVIMCCFFPH